jgi:transcriptional regulator with XRE-family HTH domain
MPPDQDAHQGLTGRRRTDVLVGARIADRRLELGLTLQQVEEETAIPVPMLSTIETGSIRASPEMLAAIARALGVAVHHFFAGYGGENSKSLARKTSDG